MGERPLSWPYGRGAVIGAAAALVLAGNPLLGLALVGLEAWWIRGLRGRGVPARDVRAVTWTAAGVGAAVLVGTGAAFALFSVPDGAEKASSPGHRTPTAVSSASGVSDARLVHSPPERR